MMDSVLQAFEPRTGATFPDVSTDSLSASLDASSAWLRALVFEAVRAATPPPRMRWIKASVGSNVRLIDVDEVAFFRADSNYTLVAMAGSEMLIRKSLQQLRAELDPACWWTIHRSTIVNVRAIDEVRRTDKGRIVVSLKRRSEVLPVSEANANQFRQM
jgi:DNA-binding LytR/AlgR family response regulator